VAFPKHTQLKAAGALVLYLQCTAILNGLPSLCASCIADPCTKFTGCAADLSLLLKMGKQLVQSLLLEGSTACRLSKDRELDGITSSPRNTSLVCHND
jgi:hypothetical protein